jgi:hypothetical protein
MRILFAFLVLVASLQAQTNAPVAFYLDNTGGKASITELQRFPSSFSFPDTPVGSASSVGLRVVNASTNAIELAAVGFVNGSQQNNDFFSDLLIGLSLAPGQSQYFEIYFLPLTTGGISATAEIGVGGTQIVVFSTVQGNGTAVQLGLSCKAATPISRCDGSTLQPDLATAVNFGNVSTTSSVTATFSLKNGGSTAINPQQLVALKTATNNPSTAFQLGPLPNSIAPGATGSFTITFAPGSATVQTGTLAVGSNLYALQGAGVANVVGDISSLTLTYTDTSGVRLTAQGASPIDFGNTIVGTGINPVLLFNVSNPATTIGAVSVSTISVSGTGFALQGTNPAPASIQPGTSISFSVVFTPPSAGTYSGSLSIGTRVFNLTGKSTVSSFPAPSIAVDIQPLVSAQQAHLTIQLASAAPSQEIGTLTMRFTPSVANDNDDAAIEFVATASRQMQVTVPSGSTTGSYNGQSSITFQTGTTAGTIQFTMQFPNQAPVSQSYTIAPAQIQISTGQAVRQAPNLVVTLTGFDNTHTAGQLAFLFYDTSGRLITPSAIAYDATSAFQQNVFNSSTPGGAFSLQASFPVTGDVTQVGSVAVTLKNSAGQTSTTQTFQ